jgi:hypothetical protein
MMHRVREKTHDVLRPVGPGAPDLSAAEPELLQGAFRRISVQVRELVFQGFGRRQGDRQFSR